MCCGLALFVGRRGLQQGVQSRESRRAPCTYNPRPPPPFLSSFLCVKPNAPPPTVSITLWAGATPPFHTSTAPLFQLEPLPPSSPSLVPLKREGTTGGPPLKTPLLSSPPSRSPIRAYRHQQAARPGVPPLRPLAAGRVLSPLLHAQQALLPPLLFSPSPDTKKKQTYQQRRTPLPFLRALPAPPPILLLLLLNPLNLLCQALCV